MQDQPKQPQAQTVEQAKKKYTPPQVTRHGGIVNLTRGPQAVS